MLCSQGVAQQCLGRIHHSLAGLIYCDIVILGRERRTQPLPNDLASWIAACQLIGAACLCIRRSHRDNTRLLQWEQGAWRSCHRGLRHFRW